MDNWLKSAVWPLVSKWLDIVETVGPPAWTLVRTSSSDIRIVYNIVIIKNKNNKALMRGVSTGTVWDLVWREERMVLFMSSLILMHGKKGNKLRGEPHPCYLNFQPKHSDVTMCRLQSRWMMKVKQLKRKKSHLLWSSSFGQGRLKSALKEDQKLTRGIWKRFEKKLD